MDNTIVGDPGTAGGKEPISRPNGTGGGAGGIIENATNQVNEEFSPYRKIDVLPCIGANPGFVRLVDSMGSDLSVVRAARVSYNCDWRVGEDAGKDEKLINYLYKNHHTSPFESVTFTFEVKAPIFVFRQWHRHRTWSYNEISARYTELDEGYYIPEVDQITTQNKSNKQMRTKEQHPHALHHQLRMKQLCEASFEIYKYMLADGVPRELARGVLPVFTYSRMFATVNLHNMLHFITLRDHEHAQHEVQVYAKAMKELITPIVPYTIKAFDAAIEYNVTVKEFYEKYFPLMSKSWAAI